MDPTKETTDAVFKVLKADKPNQVAILQHLGLSLLLIMRPRISSAGIVRLDSQHGAPPLSGSISVSTARAIIATWVFISASSSAFIPATSISQSHERLRVDRALLTAGS